MTRLYFLFSFILFLSFSASAFAATTYYVDGDFHLKKGSPAIDAGPVIPLIQTSNLSILGPPVQTSPKHFFPLPWKPIAPFGAKVRLTATDKTTNQIVFDSITTANPSSQWGINIPAGVELTNSAVTISSINPRRDYNQLQPIN